MVEQWSPKPKVVGSSPISPANKRKYKMKAIKFFREVKSEAKKVSWGSFAHTRMLTIIVTVIAILFALYMFAVDTALQSVIDFIVKF